VGIGGYPNILGEVELDAALMEGKDLTSGAVGAMRYYEHPISVARKVLDNLPHVFLVAEGAERFAGEMGFERRNLLTPEVRKTWQKQLNSDIPPDQLSRFPDIPDLWRWIEITTDPEHTHGTTNFMALDKYGTLAAGVSTSGWAWKYPGRLGDSPIVGAGLYADNRYGAAACTGTGEMAIRSCTAHSVVFYIKFGLSVEEAGQQAMDDLNNLGGNYLSGMNIIILTPDGLHGGFSSRENTHYSYITYSMSEPKQAQRIIVPINQRWQKKLIT
jgi:isoaspartyl peptidase/L-asparaginase-like protein (Ntn-hydrolase superfamily)